MTKKHFEWAAAYLRDMRRVLTAAEHARHVRTCVDLFSEFSPRFDEARFRAACGGQDATDSAGRTVRYGTVLACGRCGVNMARDPFHACKGGDVDA